MQTWVKATLGVFALLAVVVLALAGTGAYFALSHLDRRNASQAESVKQMEAVRARFGPRSPLVEILDPRRGDIRINRLAGDNPGHVTTVHVISWNSKDGELVQTQVPLWLMRFSSVNILSQLGVAPARFRLTVADIEQYGPGIVVDYSQPQVFRVLVWVD